ncbi:MAG: hypothetical protein J6S44_02465 [Clostridia bacterium]|nr:hypothetical protein [Clostridia bacterium]
MEYISDRDYEYIINKYHDTTKPYDIMQRFVRHDAIFDESTGLDGDEIKAQILERDKENEHLSHPIRKALAFDFVLKNTRISCDDRDIFPNLNSMDRPLDVTLYHKWRKEVFGEIIPEVGKRRVLCQKEGVATMWPDFSHSVPDWERVFALGFSGLKSEAARAADALAEKRPLTDKEKDFFLAIDMTYASILALLDRYEKLAKKTPGSEKMAKALANIKVAPPATFYEVLLVDHIYFIVSEHIQGMQVRSVCNFDRILYPYYVNDLKKGVTEEEIRRDLAYFLLQIHSINNYWGQPVYLGGCRADGSTEINELSYLFLDVYDKMGIFNPKIQIKVAQSTPKAFICKALDMIRRGNNSIVFVSDATIRKSLMNMGATEEEARLCNVKGCYEYEVVGSMGCGMNYINLLKPMEYALHKGCDGVTGRFVGLKSEAPDSYADFDAFYNEYKRQLRFLLDTVMETVNDYEDYLEYINPQSMLAATYTAALERGRDPLSGGAKYNHTSMDVGFLADAADSLAMIKKYVFDKKELTLSRLVTALDANFEGYEDLRRKLYYDRDKYGNNKDLPDGFAKEIHAFITSYVCGKPSAKERLGEWCCGFHTARMCYIQGATTAASPNGRRLGDELAKNCSASMGQNREGATAAVLSITKLDATRAVDVSLDLGLLPSAVKGEDGLEAMYGIVMTFVKRGGHAVHINVFDADTLRDAQAHPEKYEDLQIRVCGWNVLWNNINKEEQDGFIRQAESLV